MIRTMKEKGVRNPSIGIGAIGLKGLAGVAYNLSEPLLYEQAIVRGEARIAAGGALVADTGAHTGRSPKDKFIVRDATTEATVWWDNNSAMTVEAFDRLLADMAGHVEGMDLFVQDLYGGADPENRIAVRVVTELAWHSLFIRNMLIRPDRATLASFVADMTIIDLPSFKADPARHGCRSETVIACDFSRKIVLIG